MFKNEVELANSTKMTNDGNHLSKHGGSFNP